MFFEYIVLRVFRLGRYLYRFIINVVFLFKFKFLVRGKEFLESILLYFGCMYFLFYFKLRVLFFRILD